MKKKFSGGSVIRSLAVIFTAILGVTSNAQNPSLRVFEDWNSQAGTQNMFQRSVVRTEPGTTNYFLAGATLNAGGNYDLLVTKYNGGGAVIWSQQVNGNGNGDDYAADLQIDNSGSVIVTGTTFESSADSFNVLTVMYDSGGNQQWIASYNGSGSGNDGATSIYVDNANGDIYVAGAEWQGSSTLYDVLLIKYDSGGNQQWTANYDNTNLVDVAVRVRQNIGTGNIEVGGATQTTLTNRKYLVAEFDPSSGSLVNAYTSTSSTLGIENLTDLKTDNNGNVFVTGSITGASTGMDIRTLMLDTNLSIVWSATYSGTFNDEGNALDLDAAGNVLVTGYTTSYTQGRNFITIKYNSAGSQLWATTFNGGANGDDSAACIAVHPTDTNKIYVCGYNYNGSNKDYQTLKYDGAGNQKWEIGFNNIYNTDDRAFAIALDTVGNVIVAGQNKLNDSTYTYTTVKYIEKITLIPQDTASTTSTSFVFTENKGQLLDSDTLPASSIRFYTMHSSPAIFFSDTATSYVFCKKDTTTNTDSTARVDMKFVNSNSDLRVRSLEQTTDYLNFYRAHIPEGRERVPNYTQLVSFNVWNNVDIIYGSNLKGLKYYFLCKPGGGGASYASIDLYYEGADSVKVDGSGQLIIYTRFGNIVQPKAAAWQLDANGNYQSLGWQPSYNIVGTNEVKFTGLGSYNSSLTLVFAIDWGNAQFSLVTNPRWSTYLGGSNDDWGTDVKVNDATDEVFITGLTYSWDFPRHLAYDGYISGPTDAFYGCFKPDRSRKWMTFFGGSDSDNGAQIEIGTNGMLYGIGSTLSPDFPQLYTSGVYHESTTTTTSTAFIVRLLQGTGTATWSTRFGSNNTSGAAIGLDANNNVFITGSTTNSTPGSPTCTAPSNSGFPLCDPGGGAYYDATFSSSSSGAHDGYIAEVSASGQILWSTYFGGDAVDKIYDLYLDPNGNLYLVGSTTTSTATNNSCGVPTNAGFPLCPPPSGTYYQSTHSGGTDGFLIEFNSSLQLSWSTYIGGTNNEVVSNIVVTNGGSVYVTGLTSTSTPDATTCATPTGGGFPNCAVNSSYTQNFMTGGGSDAFVLRFKGEDLIWGTYLGGDGEDGYISGASSWPVLSHDANNNVYVAISSFTPNSSSNNPAITQYNSAMNYNISNNHDVANSNYGYSEVLLYTFTPNNYILWGTYFGGTGALTVSGPDYGEMPTGMHCGANALFITGILYTTNAFPVVGPVTSISYTQGNTTVNTNPGGGDAFITEFDITQVAVGFQNDPVKNEPLINIFPNPAMNGSINLVIHSGTSEAATVQIFDAIGNVVYDRKHTLTAGGYTPIDVSFLTSGMYFVRVDSQNGEIHSEKFIIQK